MEEKAAKAAFFLHYGNSEIGFRLKYRIPRPEPRP